jgi:hypothetical protein
MVAKGYFKVIISTNFDRLMEQALEMEGISPTVISTTDAVLGASPITHTKCTLIKVHGDYRDTRLRNTSLELSQYEASLNALLNRIFDEFGLIICGWSATWDTALRGAILSSPNRRYSVTWANKGQMSPEATELVRFKGASVIEIESADDFFSSTAEKLDALERFNSPHPISTAIAVASLKKYLVEDRFRIELSELLSKEAERQISNLQNAFGESRIFSSEEFVEGIRRCEQSLQTLIAVIANGAFWGRSEHSEVWLRTIVRMLDIPQDRSGYTILQNVRRYPACILLYAAGISAVASDSYETLERIVKYRRMNTEDQFDERDVPFVDKLTAQAVLDPDVLKKALGNNYRTPSSERLYALLRDPLRSIIPSDSQYDDAFDRFEYLLALVVCDERMKANRSSPFGPIGRFGWKRSSNSYSRPKISVVFQREQDAEGAAWGPIKSGIFTNAERYAEVEKEFLEKVLVHFRDY